MALFYDFKVNSPDDSSPTAFSWHKNYPLLAVAFNVRNEGRVEIFMDEGETVDKVELKKTCLATSVAWHPQRKILAIGWANGTVLLWNDFEKISREDSAIHKGAVLFVEWSTYGNRLISGDSDGMIAMWKSDPRGRISTGTQFLKKGRMTHILQRPRIEQRLSATECPPFFFGGSLGIVYSCDSTGHCTEACQVAGSVHSMLLLESKDILVIVTDANMLSQFGIGADMTLQHLSKVKLACGPSLTDLVWVGPAILAYASSENRIRITDFHRDENYVLSIGDKEPFTSNDIFSHIAYNTSKGVLSAATDRGHVIMWRFTATSSPSEPVDHWKFSGSFEVTGRVNKLLWGGGRSLLAIWTLDDGVKILNEQIINHAFWEGCAAVQMGPSSLALRLPCSGNDGETVSSAANFQCLDISLRAKGVALSSELLAAWNGKEVVVYEIGEADTELVMLGSFSCESTVIAVHRGSLYICEGGKVDQRNPQGSVKETFSFKESEGEPTLIHVSNNHLVICTTVGVIRLWDISRREPRAYGMLKKISDLLPEAGPPISIRVNCDGTRVSLVTSPQVGAASGALSDTVVHVFEVDGDSLSSFDLSVGVSGGPPSFPVSHFWDSTDPKLLVVEGRILQNSRAIRSNTSETDEDPTESIIFSLFATPENGVVLQDSFPLTSSQASLIGVRVPYYYIATENNRDIGDQLSDTANTSNKKKKTFAKSAIETITMRDFVGLEDCDVETRTAMADFSFYLTIGQMDEAFKAVKLIRSDGVWDNMARMCVKTRRLDVAQFCLGQLGNARGAKAVREAMVEPELDARVAMLAIQLGLLKEAEELYLSAERYDLLNLFYQAKGDWERALKVAESSDRIHLRATYYNYAREQEAMGNITAAIEAYEKSKTHRYEVPRLLLQDTDRLEAYVNKKKDRKLLKWWAQYCESIGEMETALQCYSLSRDHLSMVRVHCYRDELDQAAEITNQTEDPAACYHLARQFENMGETKKALGFYSRASRFNHAIRLCKQHGMDGELMNLALRSDSNLMVDVARYYEGKGLMEKAIMLYHKGGAAATALELCFVSKQFTSLGMISEELDERTDPALLERVTNFFVDHHQYDQAVNFLIVTKRFDTALDMCLDNNVSISEYMADRITIDKSDTDKRQNEKRIKLLMRVADCCEQQGSFHLATKKYTQAGDKNKAMRSLLKSADTEKIIFFANVSRQKDIYVMAANYLQSLNWRADSEIMKAIRSFYTKAHAYESLSGFYDACAQVEIDEYQNYSQACIALKEALKCIGKAKLRNAAEKEFRIAALTQRVHLIGQFTEYMSLEDVDPESMVHNLQMLLDEPNIETAIRIGDAYAVMVKHFVSRGDNKEAFSAIKQLRARQPSINLEFYIAAPLLKSVFEAVGVRYGSGSTKGSRSRLHDSNVDDNEYDKEAMEKKGSRLSDDEEDNEIFDSGSKQRDRRQIQDDNDVEDDDNEDDEDNDLIVDEVEGKFQHSSSDSDDD